MNDNSPKTALTVGEVAKRSGVAVSTVHFYEARSLIKGWRTEGNQRRYHRSVLRRIAIIRVALLAGVPLATVRDALIDLPHDRVPTKADWARFAKAWRDMLEQRIFNLTQLRDQITSCIGCGCLSLEECPLRNPDDELGRAGPGPRRLGAKP
ncbi:redox-sensitive transcriptional activator SoxR [Rhodoblastus sphagnicola]|uniref:Redox-sensitive transcriptional activator SoxR n=1 Tax=Rhodoblastus sphagnicola TaxID=333368 RepID=A0A2S6NC69_9HYPH|nr:redox-sensitive transcriptional activator SoxR [Rhodoblastus sphagnicola]MBB4200657.1 MerR family redox-sensitive transcriptional activator SoxR [Rhodoblastus sphagnicola]PPQ32222.1 redox-sensitive transcriptional activator SoxR [Rhodoblastus sphagnicola]